MILNYSNWKKTIEESERFIREALVPYLLNSNRVIKILPSDGLRLNESMYDWAKSELKKLTDSSEEGDMNRPIIEPFIPEILALIKKFANSGQSGGSAPFTSSAITQAIKKLMSWEPIMPITGEDWEWNDVSGVMSNGRKVLQNLRLSSVFKDEEEKPYFLDAIVFKGQNGMTFTSNCVEMKDGSKLGSSHYIKEFPFKPKTFIIDVIETEWADKNETEEKEGGGWWTHKIKDESQLEDVFKYYDKRIPKIRR